MAITSTISPDSRGRLALGPLIDRKRVYTAECDADGVIVITPVAAVLSDEQLADLQADPKGFADMIARSQAIRAGAPTVSVDEFFDSV